MTGTVEFRKKGCKGEGENNGFNASGETLGEEGTRRTFISASFWIASGSIKWVALYLWHLVLPLILALMVILPNNGMHLIYVRGECISVEQSSPVVAPGSYVVYA